MPKNKLWTIEQLNYLKANFHYRSAAEIGKYLGRTENAINLKASRIGLKKPFKVYNKEDIQFLKCYGKEFDENCVDLCPGWMHCLDEFSQGVKKDLELELKLTKLTVKNPTTPKAIITAIREVNKK